MLTVGLPLGEWGLGQGALLEAQHLVKGSWVAGLWFSLGGGRAGALWILGPLGEREARI